jgi:hypothetical protein
MLVFAQAVSPADKRCSAFGRDSLSDRVDQVPVPQFRVFGSSRRPVKTTIRRSDA